MTFGLGNDVSIRCSEIWAVESGGLFPYENALVITVATEYRVSYGYKISGIECNAVLRYLRNKYSVTRVLLQHDAAGVMEAALAAVAAWHPSVREMTRSFKTASIGPARSFRRYNKLEYNFCRLPAWACLRPRQ